MTTHVTHGQIVSSLHVPHGHGQPPPFAQLPIVGVTADSTLWTADTICVTADGRIICTPASVAEAASAFDGLDAVRIAGGAVIAADVLEVAAAIDALDAVSVVSAILIEPTGALDEVGAAVGAQVLFGTVVEAADAVDYLNAAVVSRIMALAAYYRPPAPVVGVGYGVLPRLIGEAHGTVYTAGSGAAVVPISGSATGEVDDDIELLVLMMLAA